MIKYLLTALILTVLSSCNSNNTIDAKSGSRPDSVNKKISAEKPGSASFKKIGFYTLVGDSVIVPPFEIEISLSPKAKKRITDSSETIIVDVLLSGTPKDSSNLDEMGSFFVGSAEREITYGQIARFDNVKFPKKMYDELADKDVDLNLNVYTGRKSSQFNLITGDLLFDKLSNVINKRFTLNEKLIYGDD
jgi:hypothetical protein